MTLDIGLHAEIHAAAEWHECEHGPGFFLLIDDAEAFALRAASLLKVEDIEAVLPDFIEGRAVWKRPLAEQIVASLTVREAGGVVDKATNDAS